MKLRRTTFVITQKCSLKCKLCLAFIPYFENPVNTTYEEAKNILKNYFAIVDQVGTFSITGGEPLINPDFEKILIETMEYREQIQERIDMVTNGTILFGDNLLNILESNKHIVRVIISNYGENLSTKLSQIVTQLEERGICYRIQDYDIEKEHWTYDGWVDFSDHSLKHDTMEKLLEQCNRCIFRLGHYYVINDGELHPCSRQYWRMRNNIIEKDKDWYIDLNTQSVDIDEDKKRLEFLENTKYLKSCAYCNGTYNGIERFKPAEQL